MNKKALKRKTLRLSARKIHICNPNHVCESKMRTNHFKPRFFNKGSRATVLQQGFQARLCSAESFIKLHRIVRTALFKNILTESFCRSWVEDAMLLESLKRIGIQTFCPQVTVITGIVTAHDVTEVSSAVAWSNLRNQSQLSITCFSKATTSSPSVVVRLWNSISSKAAASNSVVIKP